MSRGWGSIDIQDMPTEKYPGVLALFLLSSLSPSQLWMLNTTAALYDYLPSAPSSVACTAPPPLPHIAQRVASRWQMLARFDCSGKSKRSGWSVEIAYHPMYLLRMKIAAIGSVEDRVEDSSAPSALPAGSWYGITRGEDNY